MSNEWPRWAPGGKQSRPRGPVPAAEGRRGRALTGLCGRGAGGRPRSRRCRDPRPVLSAGPRAPARRLQLPLPRGRGPCAAVSAPGPTAAAGETRRERGAPSAAVPAAPRRGPGLRPPLCWHRPRLPRTRRASGSSTGRSAPPPTRYAAPPARPADCAESAAAAAGTRGAMAPARAPRRRLRAPRGPGAARRPGPARRVPDRPAALGSPRSLSVRGPGRPLSRLPRPPASLPPPPSSGPRARRPPPPAAPRPPGGEGPGSSPPAAPAPLPPDAGAHLPAPPGGARGRGPWARRGPREETGRGREGRADLGRRDLPGKVSGRVRRGADESEAAEEPAAPLRREGQDRHRRRGGGGAPSQVVHPDSS